MTKEISQLLKDYEVEVLKAEKWLEENIDTFSGDDRQFMRDRMKKRRKALEDMKKKELEGIDFTYRLW